MTTIGTRTVCSDVEHHEVTPNARFCDQCGRPTKQVADGPTQLAGSYTAETRIFKFKCGRCGEQVGHTANKCGNPDCNARLGADADMISWDQLSLKEQGRWPLPAAPVYSAIPHGGFDTRNQPVQQQKRPWLLYALIGLLFLAFLAAGGFALYQSGMRAQAEQALRDMPQQAAAIVIPTDAPSPTPTTAPASPTSAEAAVVLPTEVPTSEPPTAVPDDRPLIESQVELHQSTPAGEVIATLEKGEPYKAYYWMSVGGDTYLYGVTDKGTGWFNNSGAKSFKYQQVAEAALVQGVKAQYINRGDFITQYGERAIAWAYTDGTYSQRVTIGASGDLAITNGDFIVVLKREGTTLYFKTLTNIVDDAAALNYEGAIPEWVVTNNGVPPAPMPVPTARATAGSNGGGASCKGTFEAWRYRYTVKVVPVANGHSRIQAIVNYPGGYCSYVLKSVGVTVGTSLTWGSRGGLTDVANGYYDVSFVQFKQNENAPISTIGVNVTNGVTSQVIFTATEIKDR